MSEHTPGPWEFSEFSYFIAGPDGYAVAESSRTRRSECKANARLIAAAPDLLAAAENLMNNAEKLDWPSVNDIDLILAAIAKAKGEPNDCRTV